MHNPWDGGRFRRVLRHLMNDTGLSPQDIAGMAGVSRPQVSRWASGENRPGFDALQRLARALRRDYPVQDETVTDLLLAAGYESDGRVAPLPAERAEAGSPKWASLTPDERQIVDVVVELLLQRRAAAENGPNEESA